MINLSNLETLTDKIAKQVYTLRTYLGEEQSSTPSVVDTICDSLYECMSTVISGANKGANNDLIGGLNTLQSILDWQSISRQYYGFFMGNLDTHLINSEDIPYSGFSNAGIDLGARYASEFCRLIELCGYTLFDGYYCYYDQTDILGTYVVSGAGVGALTLSQFVWASDIDGTYGCQPSTGLEVEAKTVIGAAPIVITVNAINYEGGAEILTCTLPNASIIGAKVSMTGTTPLADYIMSIQSCHITGGTAADEFYIRFNPTRDIVL